MTHFSPAERIYLAGHQGMVGQAFMRRFEAGGFVNIITAPRADLELTRQEPVERFFAEQRPETVIMAAGRVGGIIENRDKPGDFIADNLAIQLNVMNAARRAGVKRLIFFGSSCMYPRECQQPMSEAMLLTGPMEPTSQAYSVAKLAGVMSCLAFNQQDKQSNFIPLIPNTIYGPGDNFDLNASHVLPALLRRFHEAKIGGDKNITLWGSGRPRREFVFVDDVVDAVFHILSVGVDNAILPINIGIAQDCTIAELANSIAAVVGYEGTISWDSSKPDGAPKKLLDSSRLYELGWRPRYDLAAGLLATYEWYKREHVDR